MQPVVNITIPTYNRDWSITHSLECAIGQDYSHTTITIIDDGSTDSTSNKIHDVLNHPRITYIKLAKNVGIGQVRNLSLLLSRYDALMGLDADDQMPYDAISKKVKALLTPIPKPSDIDQATTAKHFDYTNHIIYTQCHYQQALGKFKNTGTIDFLLHDIHPNLFFPNEAYRDHFIHTNSGLHSKKVFQTLGGYLPLRQMEDTEHRTRTILYGFNVRLLQEPLYVYYRSHDSITREKIAHTDNTPWLETAKFITDRIQQMKTILDPDQFRQQFTVPLDLTSLEIETITNAHLLTLNQDIPATPETLDWARTQLSRFTHS